MFHQNNPHIWACPYTTLLQQNSMRRPARLAAIMLVVALALITFTATAQAQNITHRVRVGETLGTIAANYGTTVTAIVRSNSIKNANSIYVGQSLVIPSSTKSANSPQKNTTYTSTAPQRTTTYNTNTASTNTYSSNTANSTTTRSTTTRSTTTRSATTSTSSQTQSRSTMACVRAIRQGESLYYVVGGDTLSRIASRHGVSLAALRQNNSLWSDRINIGQCIIIPAGLRVTPVPARPRGTTLVVPVATPDAVAAND